MNNKSRKFKKFRTALWKSGFGRCLIGALLIAFGAQTRASGAEPTARSAGDALTPAQIYEGGTNTYNNWIELGGGALLTQGYAGGNWDVQWPQRVALIGTADRQYGQSFVFGAAGAGSFLNRLTCLISRKITSATTTKSRIVLRKTP